MQIPEFIARQPAERQVILTRIDAIIMDKDKTVTPKIGTMMGKEMILYDDPGMFKYGLASVKNYMSLHMMPIYAWPALYSKYQALLPRASFQKGCINFKDETEMPFEIVERLIGDCADVSMLSLKEQWQQSKAAGKGKKQ